jgi:hypothetical protein
MNSSYFLPEFMVSEPMACDSTCKRAKMCQSLLKQLEQQRVSLIVSDSGGAHGLGNPISQSLRGWNVSDHRSVSIPSANFSTSPLNGGAKFFVVPLERSAGILKESLSLHAPIYMLLKILRISRPSLSSTTDTQIDVLDSSTAVGKSIRQRWSPTFTTGRTRSP